MACLAECRSRRNSSRSAARHHDRVRNTLRTNRRRIVTFDPAQEIYELKVLYGCGAQLAAQTLSRGAMLSEGRSLAESIWRSKERLAQTKRPLPNKSDPFVTSGTEWLPSLPACQIVRRCSATILFHYCSLVNSRGMRPCRSATENQISIASLAWAATSIANRALFCLNLKLRCESACALLAGPSMRVPPEFLLQVPPSQNSSRLVSARPTP